MLPVPGELSLGRVIRPFTWKAVEDAADNLQHLHASSLSRFLDGTAPDAPPALASVALKPPHAVLVAANRLADLESLQMRIHPYSSLFWTSVTDANTAVRMGWRKRLVEWVWNLTSHFQLGEEVLGMAVAVADAYIAKVGFQLSRNSMQLLYLASLIIIGEESLLAADTFNAAARRRRQRKAARRRRHGSSMAASADSPAVGLDVFDVSPMPSGGVSGADSKACEDGAADTRYASAEDTEDEDSYLSDLEDDDAPAAAATPAGTPSAAVTPAAMTIDVLRRSLRAIAPDYSDAEFRDAEDKIKASLISDDFFLTPREAASATVVGLAVARASTLEKERRAAKEKEKQAIVAVAAVAASVGGAGAVPAPGLFLSTVPNSPVTMLAAFHPRHRVSGRSYPSRTPLTELSRSHIRSAGLVNPWSLARALQDLLPSATARRVFDATAVREALYIAGRDYDIQRFSPFTIALAACVIGARVSGFWASPLIRAFINVVGFAIHIDPFSVRDAVATLVDRGGIQSPLAHLAPPLVSMTTNGAALGAHSSVAASAMAVARSLCWRSPQALTVFQGNPRDFGFKCRSDPTMWPTDMLPGAVPVIVGYSLIDQYGYDLKGLLHGHANSKPDAQVAAGNDSASSTASIPEGCAVVVQELLAHLEFSFDLEEATRRRQQRMRIAGTLLDDEEEEIDDFVDSASAIEARRATLISRGIRVTPRPQQQSQDRPAATGVGPMQIATPTSRTPVPGAPASGGTTPLASPTAMASDTSDVGAMSRPSSQRLVTGVDGSVPSGATGMGAAAFLRNASSANDVLAAGIAAAANGGAMLGRPGSASRGIATVGLAGRTGHLSRTPTAPADGDEDAVIMQVGRTGVTPGLSAAAAMASSAMLPTASASSSSAGRMRLGRHPLDVSQSGLSSVNTSAPATVGSRTTNTADAYISEGGPSNRAPGVVLPANSIAGVTPRALQPRYYSSEFGEDELAREARNAMDMSTGARGFGGYNQPYGLEGSSMDQSSQHAHGTRGFAGASGSFGDQHGLFPQSPVQQPVPSFRGFLPHGHSHSMGPSPIHGTAQMHMHATPTLGMGVAMAVTNAPSAGYGSSFVHDPLHGIDMHQQTVHLGLPSSAVRGGGRAVGMGAAHPPTNASTQSYAQTQSQPQFRGNGSGISIGLGVGSPTNPGHPALQVQQPQQQQQQQQQPDSFADDNHDILGNLGVGRASPRTVGSGGSGPFVPARKPYRPGAASRIASTMYTSTESASRRSSAASGNTGYYPAGQFGQQQHQQQQQQHQYSAPAGHGYFSQQQQHSFLQQRQQYQQHHIRPASFSTPDVATPSSGSSPLLVTAAHAQRVRTLPTIASMSSASDEGDAGVHAEARGYPLSPRGAAGTSAAHIRLLPSE
jgi:hypothetical protein